MSDLTIPEKEVLLYLELEGVNLDALAEKLESTRIEVLASEFSAVLGTAPDELALAIASTHRFRILVLVDETVPTPN